MAGTNNPFGPYPNPFEPGPSNLGIGHSAVSLLPVELDSRTEKILHAREHRFVIAVDYGTTYTGVAYATPSGDDAALEDIDIVDNWGPKMGNRDKVPSVISYSNRSAADEANWGSDLAPNALTMINTKLELDLNSVSDELALVRQTLEGVNHLDFKYIRLPKHGRAYTWKKPEDIVADYLTRVFEYLLIHMSQFSNVLRQQLQLDLVITIPAANWSYRAKNSTFRALQRAGFNKENFPKLNDMILIKEPEAAAIYTARFLKQKHGRDFLKVNDCFILCDCGGGTVDIVAYLVKKVYPTLEIHRLTLPTTRKCGSVFIDRAFKTWLKQLIGPNYYKELDSDPFSEIEGSYKSESQPMRKLMEGFIRWKERFNSASPEFPINLPDPANINRTWNINLERKVEGGEIRISNKIMRGFFDPCINSILDMVDNQTLQVEIEGRRVKHLFLVGGFGESVYLRERLTRSLELRNINLDRPKESWTAVVRGAVIAGVEKSNAASIVRMEGCQRSYGICIAQMHSDTRHNGPQDRIRNKYTMEALARDQMLWFHKKGDVLLSDSPLEKEKPFAIQFEEEDHEIRRGSLLIYASDDDTPPERYQTARHDLETVLTLNYDLMTYPEDHFEEREKSEATGGVFYEALLNLKIKIANGRLYGHLSFRGRGLASDDVPYP